MTTITDGEVLTPGATTIGVVELEGGWITSVGPSADRRRGGAVFDARGLTVAPGFIDAQVNGAHGIDITSEPDRMGDVGDHLVRYGVTAFAPTIISCSPRQRAEAVRAAPAAAAAATPIGIHLEGPMLNPARRGAHPERWLELPSPRVIDGWTRPNGVRMVTLAPELPGAIDIIGRLTAAGVVVSLGHTDADAACIDAAVSAGATAVTHLFNAMAPFSPRAPGPVGATLASSSLVAGLICDGIHVDPVAVRAAWRALGPRRTMVVSDATAALGMHAGRHHLGETMVDVSAMGVRAADGRLAGSDIALDASIRNLVDFTGCSPRDAIESATATPARILGLADRGALVAGLRADVTVLDVELRVVATFVGGRLVHLAEEAGGRWSG